MLPDQRYLTQAESGAHHSDCYANQTVLRINHPLQGEEPGDLYCGRG